ncbi:hypothetical protein LXL04_013308 [Taraxacum kok-saghyz]
MEVTKLLLIAGNNRGDSRKRIVADGGGISAAVPDCAVSAGDEDPQVWPIFLQHIASMATPIHYLNLLEIKFVAAAFLDLSALRFATAAFLDFFAFRFAAAALIYLFFPLVCCCYNFGPFCPSLGGCLSWYVAAVFAAFLLFWVWWRSFGCFVYLYLDAMRIKITKAVSLMANP